MSHTRHHHFLCYQVTSYFSNSVRTSAIAASLCWLLINIWVHCWVHFWLVGLHMGVPRQHNWSSLQNCAGLCAFWDRMFDDCCKVLLIIVAKLRRDRRVCQLGPAATFLLELWARASQVLERLMSLLMQQPTQQLPGSKVPTTGTTPGLDSWQDSTQNMSFVKTRYRLRLLWFDVGCFCNGIQFVACSAVFNLW